MKKKVLYLTGSNARCLFVATCLLICTNAWSTARFVKASGTAGTGISWSNPLIGAPGIRTAFTTAGIDTIYIAGGAYDLSTMINPTQGFRTSSKLNLFVSGGYDPSATGTDLSSYNPSTYVTTLQSADYSSGGYSDIFNIVSGNANFALRGLDLLGGGSAVYYQASSLTQNLSFTDLVVRKSGTLSGSNSSGIGLVFGATSGQNIQSVAISNSSFRLNNSFTQGGAITILSSSGQSNVPFNINNCTFSDNNVNLNTTGPGGGAIYIKNINNGTIQNSSFCNNSTTTSTNGSYGGAICANDWVGGRIEDCNFQNNKSTASNSGANGGAVAILISTVGLTPSVTMTNDLFYGNNRESTQSGVVMSDIGDDIMVNSGTITTLSSSKVQLDPAVGTNYPNLTITDAGTGTTQQTTNPGISCNTVIIPLPVTLTSFTSAVQGGQVLLSWAVTTGMNSKGFTIERSTGDPADFTAIGFVASAKEESGQTYHYVDAAPYAGRNYYRLKQQDLNGSFSYSHTVSATVSDKGTVRLFPNPSKKLITIAGVGPGNVSYRITDMTGQTMLTTTMAVIDISGLVPGLYFLQIISGNDMKQMKFVKE